MGTVGTTTRANSDSKVTVTVTFVHPNNSGDQPMLEILTAGCTLDGCQPRYAGVTDLKTSTSGVTETTKGTTENLVCSGRGTCNVDDGVCECYEGYKGRSCETQTTVV